MKGSLPVHKYIHDVYKYLSHNTQYTQHTQSICVWYRRKKGAVTKQPLKFKKLLVDYMKSTNNFFVFLSKKGPEGPFSLV